MRKSSTGSWPDATANLPNVYTPLATTGDGRVTLCVGMLVRVTRKRYQQPHGPKMQVVRIEPEQSGEGFYVVTEYDIPTGKGRSHFSRVGLDGRMIDHDSNWAVNALVPVGFPEGFTPDLFGH